MLLFQVRAVLAKKRASVHELFCEMDANGDGVLSRTELHAGLVSLGIPLVGDAFDALWKFLDTNGDGIVDRDEFNFFVHIQEVEPGVFTTAMCSANDQKAPKEDPLTGSPVADKAELPPHEEAVLSYLGSQCTLQNLPAMFAQHNGEKVRPYRCPTNPTHVLVDLVQQPSGSPMQLTVHSHQLLRVAKVSGFTIGSKAPIGASCRHSIKTTIADISRTFQNALHIKRCTLEQLFAEIDEDGSGGIDRKEFTRAMRKLDIVMVRRSFGDMHAALR
jgi:Ca2+-binding EF-hand superfamily protein